MKRIFTSSKVFTISATKFIILFSILNILFYNFPIYKYSLNTLEIFSSNTILILFSITIALFAISAFIFFVISIFLPESLIKYFFIIITIFNSIALYFVNTYNVILDKSMMGNIFNTNSSEAFSYYDINILLYILFLGLIPSLLIYRINIKKPKVIRLFSFAITIIIPAVGILYINSTTWLWFDKHAKILGGLTLPWSYSINSIRYKQKELKKNQKLVELPNIEFLNTEEKLVVLIIGESARAANFSLYGYERKTNPKLKNQDIKVLKNSNSTTTYTTASIHSMLSYKGSTSDNFETLPNYLQRQGVDVLWRANNWGQPKLNIANFKNSSDLKGYCKSKDCEYDGILLSNLKKDIENIESKKKFVVLHTAGSHGPTYYKKYPKNFEIFKPVCKSVDVSSCTKEELINAYDNTILYADHLISSTIEILKQIKTPSMMIYISDHGESLAEYGLYLHGTPYSIAPNFQKAIPFLIWKSNDYEKKVKAQNSYGQNNIFHTTMNALDLRSEIYNEKYNILDDKE